MKQTAWFFAFTFSLLASVSAQAQWQWVDHSGRKIYSDQAPPKDVPESKIIKGADGRPYMAVVPIAELIKNPKYSTPSDQTAVLIKNKVAAPAVAASAAATAKPVTAEAKKAAEKKLADEKKAEQARLAAERERQESEAKECARMANSLASLNSGARIATLDAKGERSFMDEATLAAERKRLTDMMAERCR